MDACRTPRNVGTADRDDKDGTANPRPPSDKPKEMRTSAGDTTVGTADREDKDDTADPRSPNDKLKEMGTSASDTAVGKTQTPGIAVEQICYNCESQGAINWEAPGMLNIFLGGQEGFGDRLGA